MVLVVGVVVLHHDVKHGPRVGDGHLGLLRVGGGDGVVLWEGRRKDAPNTICVKLQRPTNLCNGRLGEVK